MYGDDPRENVCLSGDGMFSMLVLDVCDVHQGACTDPRTLGTVSLKHIRTSTVGWVMFFLNKMTNKNENFLIMTQISEAQMCFKKHLKCLLLLPYEAGLLPKKKLIFGNINYLMHNMVKRDPTEL